VELLAGRDPQLGGVVEKGAEGDPRLVEGGGEVGRRDDLAAAGLRELDSIGGDQVRRDPVALAP
jgi:hypothetical protein